MSSREPSALNETTGIPASRALSTGPRNAALSTTHSPMPSALPVTAVLVASTISATTEFTEPVHWYWMPSSLHASSAPYWVGVKNGLVVTWQTRTIFQFGVFGKLPIAAAVAGLSVHAVSRVDAASEALTRPAPWTRRRRLRDGRLSVSTASSTLG